MKINGGRSFWFKSERPKPLNAGEKLSYKTKLEDALKDLGCKLSQDKTKTLLIGRVRSLDKAKNGRLVVRKRNFWSMLEQAFGFISFRNLTGKGHDISDLIQETEPNAERYNGTIIAIDSDIKTGIANIAIRVLLKRGKRLKAIEETAAHKMSEASTKSKPVESAKAYEVKVKAQRSREGLVATLERYLIEPNDDDTLKVAYDYIQQMILSAGLERRSEGSSERMEAKDSDQSRDVGESAYEGPSVEDCFRELEMATGDKGKILNMDDMQSILEDLQLLNGLDKSHFNRLKTLQNTLRHRIYSSDAQEIFGEINETIELLLEEQPLTPPSSSPGTPAGSPPSSPRNIDISGGGGGGSVADTGGLSAAGSAEMHSSSSQLLLDVNSILRENPYLSPMSEQEFKEIREDQRVLEFNKKYFVEQRVFLSEYKNRLPNEDLIASIIALKELFTNSYDTFDQETRPLVDEYTTLIDEIIAENRADVPVLREFSKRKSKADRAYDSMLRILSNELITTEHLDEIEKQLKVLAVETLDETQIKYLFKIAKTLSWKHTQNRAVEIRTNEIVKIMENFL